jgi:2-dehydropantoate 2-reductase
VTGKSDFVARPHAVDSPTLIPRFDVGIFATKATQLPLAAAALEGHSPNAAMMTMQNGLGAEEIVRRHGPWPLISAVTFMSGTRHSDVHVDYELDTTTWLGPYAPTGTSTALAREVGALFSEGGLEAEVMDDLRGAQWSKLIFNAAVNGVSALTGLPHVQQFAAEENPEDLGHLVRAVVEEGRAVAAAAGITLRDDPWEMNCLAVERGRSSAGEYAHVPSMLEDMRAKRPSEIDAICGALVREGRERDVPTPLMTAIYQLIKGKESSWDRLDVPGKAPAG